MLHNPATAASPAATSAGMRPPPTFSASSAATSVAPVVCPNSRMVETNPPADAVVRYGQRDEHCWSGDASAPNAMTRLTYDSRFIRKMAAHWVKTAPPGADTVSWRY